MKGFEHFCWNFSQIPALFRFRHPILPFERNCTLVAGCKPHECFQKLLPDGVRSFPVILPEYKLCNVAIQILFGTMVMRTRDPGLQVPDPDVFIFLHIMPP